MKRVLAAGAAILIAGTILIPPNLGSAQTGTAWRTFHGNISRNGVSTVSGPTDGTLANQWNLLSPVSSSPAVDANGVAYVGSDDKNVYAFNPSSPSAPKWKFATKGIVRSSPTLSNDGKVVYVGSQDNNIYALNTSDGSLVWAKDVGGPVNASPLLSPDGSTLFVANVNGQVWALKTSDGSPVWSGKGFIGLATSVAGSLAFSADGSILFVATANQYMYAIGGAQSTSPSVTTTFYLGGPASTSPAVDGNGNVYIGTLNGLLESFTPSSPVPRWIYTDATRAAIVSTPAIAQGQVMFGAADHNIYQVGASNGQQNWQAGTGGVVESSPAVSGNNLIYVGSDDGNVYALSMTGQVAWLRPTGFAVRSSPALGPDGSLWVGSDVGTVLRFKQPSGLPGTPIPVTGTPVPTGTTGPTPTSTSVTSGKITVTAKGTVKPGDQQIVKAHAAAGAVISFTVLSPNGDRQNHSSLAGPKGIATYKFRQGGSKVLHNRNVATISATASNFATGTTTYKIKFGKLDVSAEPRSVTVGQTVNIYVHAGRGKRVSAQVILPNGNKKTFKGKAGKNGFGHWHIKATIAMRVAGKKVKVIGSVQGTSSHTQTTFTVL